MIRLEYPSQSFLAAWEVNVRKGSEFDIEVRIGRIRRKFIQGFIDFMFHRGGGGLSLFGCAMFGGQLSKCIANTIGTKQYVIDYSEIESGTLIKCRREVPNAVAAFFLVQPK